MRDLRSVAKPTLLLKPTTMTDADDKSSSEVDMGNCRRGALIVTIDKGTVGITNLAVYTSEASSITPGASNIASMTQDTTNSTGTVTITTNEVVSITVDGIYVFDVTDLKRYVVVQYDGDDTDTIVSMVLIGLDPQETPYAAARSSY